ncbi:MAG: exosortase B [Rhodocyclaceae bacterium]
MSDKALLALPTPVQLLQGARGNVDLTLMLAGLAAMFVPTFWGLMASGLWTDDEHAHGPIIFVLAHWLIWNVWSRYEAPADARPAPILGWVCLVFAALLYLPGRIVDLIYFEVAAYVVALTGVIFLSGGKPLAKVMIFPLVFMLFMIPLPNALVGPISEILKTGVSAVTEEVLYAVGYPISRTGVIIAIGQYQLLVADACAGMRTLFMLEALGVFYLNVVRHTSMLRNFTLPLLIVPISFTANVVRVIVLALITYYFGDEAGQGFLHGFAGMVLFLSGLVFMLIADKLLRMIGNRFRGR